MPRRLATVLLVVVLSLSLGLHWVALQSAAWVGMVITFSQTSTLGEAINKALDGAHPCKLCKLVAAGKQQQQKQDIVKPTIKLEGSLTSSSRWIFPPATLRPPSGPDTDAPRRADPPPFPRPRLFPV